MNLLLAHTANRPCELQTSSTRQKSLDDVRHGLPDGSSLELNTGTQAELRFYEDSRHLDLIQGEVMCAVASSPQRPFIVKAGNTIVRVTGTSFTVRRDAELVRQSLRTFTSLNVRSAECIDPHYFAVLIGPDFGRILNRKTPDLLPDPGFFFVCSAVLLSLRGRKRSRRE